MEGIRVWKGCMQVWNGVVLKALRINIFWNAWKQINPKYQFINEDLTLNIGGVLPGDARLHPWCLKLTRLCEKPQFPKKATWNQGQNISRSLKEATETTMFGYEGAHLRAAPFLVISCKPLQQLFGFFPACGSTPGMTHKGMRECGMSRFHSFWSRMCHISCPSHTS